MSHPSLISVYGTRIRTITRTRAGAGAWKQRMKNIVVATTCLLVQNCTTWETPRWKRTIYQWSLYSLFSFHKRKRIFAMKMTHFSLLDMDWLIQPNNMNGLELLQYKDGCHASRHYQTEYLSRVFEGLLCLLQATVLLFSRPALDIYNHV